MRGGNAYGRREESEEVENISGWRGSSVKPF